MNNESSLLRSIRKHKNNINFIIPRLVNIIYRAWGYNIIIYIPWGYNLYIPWGYI